MSLSSNEKRLLKDVININKNPLNDQGIFYIHDTSNIKKGYALIFGPDNTIYSHGIYFFKFTLWRMLHIHAKNAVCLLKVSVQSVMNLFRIKLLQSIVVMKFKYHSVLNVTG